MRVISSLRERLFAINSYDVVPLDREVKEVGMRIAVEEIPSEGVALDVAEDPTILSVEEEPDHLRFLDLVRFIGRATRVGRTVMVEGVASTLVELSCSRCAETFAFALQCPIEVNYIYGPEPEEEELILVEEEVETVHYQGEVVDITKEVRDHLLLALPVKPLCKEDCLGLCPRCGANLNLSTCECELEERDHRFDVLRQWRSPTH